MKIWRELLTVAGLVLLGGLTAILVLLAVQGDAKCTAVRTVIVCHER